MVHSPNGRIGNCLAMGMLSNGPTWTSTSVSKGCLRAIVAGKATHHCNAGLHRATHEYQPSTPLRPTGAPDQTAQQDPGRAEALVRVYAAGLCGQRRALAGDLLFSWARA